jgi:hypothetical protein
MKAYHTDDDEEDAERRKVIEGMRHKTYDQLDSDEEIENARLNGPWPAGIVPFAIIAPPKTIPDTTNATNSR